MALLALTFWAQRIQGEQYATILIWESRVGKLDFTEIMEWDTLVGHYQKVHFELI